MYSKIFHFTNSLGLRLLNHRLASLHKQLEETERLEPGNTDQIKALLKQIHSLCIQRLKIREELTWD